jgi:hypothetical protein
MKALFKRTVFVGLLLLCFTVAAQDPIYSTVKDAFVVLTAVVQKPDGGTNRVRITNKDVLATLNATNAFNFDKRAKLLLRSVDGGIPYFVVRESARHVVTNNEVDVSDFLTLVEPDDAVHSRNQMVNWGIWTYTLNGGGGTDFTFWSLTTLHTGVIPTGHGGKLLRTVNLVSTGSGPGHIDGASAQFSGKISANHGRLDSSQNSP